MTTRTQLEETLAAQRVRRIRLNHSTPTLRKKYGGLISALAVITILIMSGTAMFFAVTMTTLKIDGATTVLYPASPSSISITVAATPIAMQVCTNIPDGRLHVRFAAGDGSEVRGYLVEGEAVQLATSSEDQVTSQIFQGSRWLRISYPIAGWVNARYVCKQEK